MLHIRSVVALMFFLIIFCVDLRSEPCHRLRMASSLSEKEMQTFGNRVETMKQAISVFTGKEITQKTLPNIGIVSSGGSLKAAVATLGLLQALESINLLDGVWGLSTLSGSTWLASSWLEQKCSLAELEIFLRRRLDKAFCYEAPDIREIVGLACKKVTTGRPFSLNDIWGTFLGNVFLDNETLSSHYLHSVERDVLSGRYPLPLFSSIIQEGEDSGCCCCCSWNTSSSLNYHWLEFSPFEIGVIGQNCWVPTCAFGKSFARGECFDAGNPESWDFLLGMFGSAYAISQQDTFTLLTEYLYGEYPNFPIPVGFFNGMNRINNMIFGTWRLSPPQVHNFMYGVQGNMFKQSRKIEPLDAGMYCNLPFPPLLRRKTDIYIVSDASSDNGYSSGEHPLSKVKRYAKKNGYLFPRFDEERIARDEISILVDRDHPKVPVVIYIPNRIDASILDFDYDAAQFTEVLSHTKNKVLTHAGAIKEALEYVIGLKEHK